MILWIVLLILFGLLTYLLLTPVSLFIDTRADKYFIQQKGIVKASVLGDKKKVLKVNIKVLFLKFHFYPLHSKRDKSIPKIKTKTKHKKRKFLSFKTGLKLIKSFKVKRFWIDIDTGDCIANAKLYPVFAFLNYSIGGFNINFQDRNQLVLHIEGKPIHIIKSFINF
ncbi:hypothetical protein GCM10023311_03310 [Flaviramulus aquimarinus]|uniref:Uncharacterized protein n=1 Tax=Flaviramulus aquimarinus TaxID=1170456 RepID=A0ABP9EZ12_9FLAO